MLRILAWLEITVSMMLLALAAWPFSGFCSGRFMGLDCESRAILGVNIFGPLGILAFTCSASSLKRKSVTPQHFMAFGVVAVMIDWLSHAP